MCRWNPERMERCCCGILSLQMGAIVIAVTGVIRAPINATFYSRATILGFLDWLNDSSIAVAIVEMMDLAACILLLVGIIKKSPSLMDPWLLFEPGRQVVMLAYGLSQAIGGLVYPTTNFLLSSHWHQAIAWFVGLLIATPIRIYFYLIVADLRAKMPNMEIECRTRNDQSRQSLKSVWSGGYGAQEMTTFGANE